MAALAFALASPALYAQDAPARPGLVEVILGFQDPNGQDLATLTGGQPVVMTLMLRDPLNGRPAADRALTGWLRPPGAGNADCATEVQAARATGMLPDNATGLDGFFLAVTDAGDDHVVGISARSFGNALAGPAITHRLPEAPGQIAGDPFGLRLLATLPDSGALIALSALSPEAGTLLSGIPGIAGVAPLEDGSFWISAPDRLSLHRPDGQQITRIGVTGLPVLLHALRFDPMGYDRPTLSRLGAYTEAGDVLILSPSASGEAGAVLARFRQPPMLSAALLGGESVLTLAENGREARLIYADDPGRADLIALPVRASRLTADPGGRYAVAWQPGTKDMVVIDSATLSARPVQQPRAGVIADLIVTGGTALALSPEGGFAQLADLGQAARVPGYAPVVLDLPVQPAGASAAAALLVSLEPSPLSLALDPAGRRAWLITPRPAPGAPATETLALQTAAPAGVQTIRRGLRRIAPGSYQTALQLPPGAQELVLTSADGAFAQCLPFTVKGTPEGSTRVALRASLQSDTPPRAGESTTITLRLEDAAGAPHAPPDLTLVVARLNAGDRQYIPAIRSPDGAFHATITFTQAGRYAVRPLQLPPELQLNTVPLIEVSP